jgi:hypothetical protein
MKKKSGKAGTPVAPSKPIAVIEADVADVGAMAAIKVEQIKNKVGKFGTLKFKPFKRQAASKEEHGKTTWIEIELVDTHKRPVAGEKYRIVMPDGTAHEGSLDIKGLARVDGFEGGSCKVTFPELDGRSWDRA